MSSPLETGVPAAPARSDELVVVRKARWLAIPPFLAAVVAGCVALWEMPPMGLRLAAATLAPVMAVAGAVWLYRVPRSISIDCRGLHRRGGTVPWAEVAEVAIRRGLGRRLELLAVGARRARGLRRIREVTIAGRLETLVPTIQRFTDVPLRYGRWAHDRNLAGHLTAGLYVATGGAVLGAFMVALPVPGVYARYPGPAVKAGAELQALDEQPRRDRQGSILEVSVTEGPAAPAVLVWSLFDDDVRVGRRDAIVGPGSPRAEQRYLRHDAEVGLRFAAAAAETALGHQVHVRGGEPTVADVNPDGPAAGRAKEGERVLSVNGQRVRFLQDVYAALAGVSAPTARVEFEGPAGGTHHEELALATSEGARVLWGVTVGSAPARLEGASTLRVGRPRPQGSSASLAAALSVLHQLGPADLARGRTVAATGTLSPEGVVGPIGGLKEKVTSAHDAGATLFLVPATQAGVTRATAPPGLAVEGVATLDEAIAVLRRP